MLDVSVVVPFYNRSFFLERLLDSVLNQTRKPKKIYLVDNGSFDDEISKLSLIMNKEKFRSIDIVFTSTVDKGNANYARNLGYILSDTQYVAFLDSDDWWEPNHLKDSIECLVRSNKSSVYSRAIIHTKDDSHVNYSVDVNNFNNPFDLLLSKAGYLATTPSFVVDKTLVNETVLWDTKLKRHQDFDYFSSIFYKGGGWCYCDKANVNVDWDDGGADKSNIDLNSLVVFYEKWEPLIPSSIKKYYLKNVYMSTYRWKSDDKYKKYYRDKIKENSGFGAFRNILYVHGYIHGYMSLVNLVDYLKLRVFIRKILKKLTHFF